MVQEQSSNTAHRRSGPGLVQELGVLEQRPAQQAAQACSSPRCWGRVLVAEKPTSSPKRSIVLICALLPSIAACLALSQVPRFFLRCHQEGYSAKVFAEQASCFTSQAGPASDVVPVLHCNALSIGTRCQRKQSVCTKIYWCSCAAIAPDPICFLVMLTEAGPSRCVDNAA